MHGHAAYCINRDLSAQSEQSDLPVTFPHHAIGDFSSLAGLMLALDAVVTTCTAHPRRRRARRAGRAAAQPESRRALGNRLAHRALSGHPDRGAARVGQWDDAIDRAMAFVLGGFGKD